MTTNNTFDLPSPTHSFTSPAPPTNVASNGASTTYRERWLKYFHRRSGANENADQSDKTRTVFIGGKTPPDVEVIVPEKFPDNRIISSKYTIINFIPKNLFEQFRRVANMYFLWVAIIQLGIESPVSPLTTSMPLAFVVTVTAIKQAYEDWLRHKADNEVNFRDTTIAKNGKLKVVRAMDIKVGNIVMVHREESFPCDMIMLSSSDKEGKCHVTTANLDGETNLKIHSSISQTKVFKTSEQFLNLVGKIECEQPHPDLYKFQGRMTFYKPDGEKQVRPLGMESVLLKGARLKNTAHVYGCAIYTGQETKMALNSRVKSNKFSTIEKSMNIFLIVFLVILILEVVICTGIRYTSSNTRVSEEWYINYGSHFSVKDLFQTGLSFLVLLNYIIPISLYVTIEMQKFVGSLFLVWDEQLYDPGTNQCAKCNTSDLNEELGQVQYLFTDKTGTLTENDMQFRQCSVSGVRYQEHNGQLCLAPDSLFSSPQVVAQYTDEMEIFLLVLTVCHTVQVNLPFRVDYGIRSLLHIPGPIPEYHASSPDEKALVEACARFGVIFKGIQDDKFIIDFQGEMRSYKCLQVLEFTSERRTMSVIVKDEFDKIYLVTKGAESSVLKKCSEGPVLETMQHVNDYAMIGLRTMVIAYKMLTVEEYRTIDRILLEARNSLENRDEKVARVCQLIEQNLHLLGAVGVEDRLQDGVPETLQMLQLAGMNIWVLTGDKMETAINISYSCGHFKRCMTQLRLIDQRSFDECEANLKELRKQIYEDPMQNYGLVIDGSTILFALEPGCIEILVEVSCQCQAVVCCRMSPLQKAEIVKMIKNYAPGKPITAAIGDGANDCSMIQEAHVGLGIMGREGRQAMRCSDFAIARFKFLQRVFLVHGHYYYVRVSTLVQYFFYKNVAFITPQVYYAFFNAFSTQTLYDGFFMSFFNIFFTSLPILTFGLFEQNIKQEVLLQKPELYRIISNNSRLSVKEFLKWNLLGFWHSLVFFFSIVFMSYDVSLQSDGQETGFQFFGTFIFHLSVVVINLKLLLESRYLTWLFAGSLAVSVCLGFMTFAIIYSAINWAAIIGNTRMYWVYVQILSLPICWLALLVVIALCLVPDVLVSVLQIHYPHIKRYLKGRFGGSNQVVGHCDNNVQPSERLPLNQNSR